MFSKNKILYILFVFYLIVFVYAVFMQYATKAINIENIAAHINLIPIKKTFHDIVFLIQYGLIGNMNLFNNIVGNVFLFLPLPFFLSRIFNIQKNTTIILVGFLLSVWVELMQYVFILGVPDIDDVILNVLGTYLGCVLITHVFKIKAQSDNKI